MIHRLWAVTLVALLVLTLALAGCTDAGQGESTPTASPSEPAATDSPSTEAPASEAPATEAPASEAADGGEAEVRIAEPDFIPEVLTVPVGTEVTWVNDDTYSHTVTEGTDGNVVNDPIVNEPIAAGGTVSVTFEEPGTYDITCEIHPTMQMTVVVEG